MKKEKHLITPERHVLRKHQEEDCALETLKGLEVGENQNLGMSGVNCGKPPGDRDVTVLQDRLSLTASTVLSHF